MAIKTMDSATSLCCAQNYREKAIGVIGGCFWGDGSGYGSGVAGEFPVDYVIENRRKIGDFDADQQRKALALGIPPVPEKAEAIENAKQHVNQQVAERKKKRQKNRNRIIISHAPILPQLFPTGKQHLDAIQKLIQNSGRAPL